MGTHPRDRLRRARASAGLSQERLATEASVTRQTLSAIEAGRATPSVDIALRLARVLGASVEELFLPSDAAHVRADGPLEARGRVAAALVGGRWVAHALPAEHADRSADALVRGASSGQLALELLRPADRARDVFLLMGCAPALGVLADRLDARGGPGIFRWLPGSSTSALDALIAERTHCAGMHLVDEAGVANVPEIVRRAPSLEAIVVTLARWEVGLAIAADDPHRIRGVRDLAKKAVRLAVRERGSGARRMLERELAAARVPMRVLSRPGTVEARGQLDVARAVALGAADVGPATRDAAAAYGLRFVALAEERFDLVLPRPLASDPRVARLLDTLTSGAWRRELTALGYTATECGDVVAELGA